MKINLKLGLVLLAAACFCTVSADKNLLSSSSGSESSFTREGAIVKQVRLALDNLIDGVAAALGKKLEPNGQQQGPYDTARNTFIKAIQNIILQETSGTLSKNDCQDMFKNMDPEMKEALLESATRVELLAAAKGKVIDSDNEYVDTASVSVLLKEMASRKEIKITAGVAATFIATGIILYALRERGYLGRAGLIGLGDKVFGKAPASWVRFVDVVVDAPSDSVTFATNVLLTPFRLVACPKDSFRVFPVATVLGSALLGAGVLGGAGYAVTKKYPENWDVLKGVVGYKFYNLLPGRLLPVVKTDLYPGGKVDKIRANPFEKYAGVNFWNKLTWPKHKDPNSL